MMSPSVEQSWFVQGMVKATTDMWLKGWDERNGGNVSLRVSAEDLAPYAAGLQGERTVALGEALPELDGQSFLVTGSGKFFRNVELDPASNLGLIEVIERGREVRVLWGYSDGGVPTSELSAHLKSHRTRQVVTNGRDRVVMHCHATNLIALSYVLHPTTAAITRALWEMSTECLVVFPDGIALLPWLVPGTDTIGDATATAMREHSLVLWPYHGVFGTGPNAGYRVRPDRYRRESIGSPRQGPLDGRRPPFDHHAEPARPGGAVRGPSAGSRPSRSRAGCSHGENAR